MTIETVIFGNHEMERNPLTAKIISLSGMGATPAAPDQYVLPKGARALSPSF